MIRSARLSRRAPMRQGKPIERKTKLQAKTPIKRGKPLNAARWGVSDRRQSKRAEKRTAEERAYLDFMHARPCVISGFECCGPIQQSHARNIDNMPTGMGRKENDFASIPMCRKHHLDEWEVGKGWFADWDRERRKAFMVAHIASEHLAFQTAGGTVPASFFKAYGLFVRVDSSTDQRS